VVMVLWRRSSFFTECYNFTTLVDRFSKVMLASSPCPQRRVSLSASVALRMIAAVRSPKHTTTISNVHSDAVCVCVCVCVLGRMHRRWRGH
jgi:hypothetical protein